MNNLDVQARDYWRLLAEQFKVALLKRCETHQTYPQLPMVKDSVGWMHLEEKAGHQVYTRCELTLEERNLLNEWEKK